MTIVKVHTYVHIELSRKSLGAELARERFETEVVIDVLCQVCSLSEGMTTELTDIGSSTGVNSKVVLEVVPLAEHILLRDAL